jgi:hypothetical protein
MSSEQQRARLKIRALAPSLVALGCAALSGCYGPNDGYYYYPPHHGPPPVHVFSLPTCPNASTPARGVGIDTDGQLTTEAGKGAGVLIEYMNGGRWHITTVCDTALSGYPCEFDVTAQAIGGKVTNLLGEQLEDGDIATSYCSDTAILGVTTSTDFDGMWFDTAQGATVRVTAALGQARYDNVFYWVSDGVVHDDANANPFELTPTAP